MGQNTFAFRVEDIDLERLKNIIGSDVAYVARLLPRWRRIHKDHALKIVSVNKLADNASVGKDLLTRGQSSNEQ